MSSFKGVKITAVQKDFGSCSEAQRYAKYTLGSGNTDAETDARIIPKVSGLTTKQNRSTGMVVLTPKVTWSLDAPLSEIRTVEVRWPRMTEADKQAAKAFAAAVLTHEQGHVLVAENTRNNTLRRFVMRARRRRKSLPHGSVRGRSTRTRCSPGWIGNGQSMMTRRITAAVRAMVRLMDFLAARTLSYTAPTQIFRSSHALSG